MKLLHIDSSITGEHSVSRQLSAAIVAKLRQTTPLLEVLRRDLAADPLPYFTAETMAAISAAPQPKLPDYRAGLRLDRRIVDEFMAADAVVIGAPMYNFGVPAQLKTWIDYLSVAGVTFHYTSQGPAGLAGGKRIFIASSRGGIYGAGSPAASAEHQLSHLLSVFGFFGIEDVTVIQAEGVRMGADQARDAIAAALARVAVMPGLALESNLRERLVA